MFSRSKPELRGRGSHVDSGYGDSSLLLAFSPSDRKCESNGGANEVLLREVRLKTKKIDPRAKANLMLKALKGKEGFGRGGKPWK